MESLHHVQGVFVSLGMVLMYIILWLEAAVCTRVFICFLPLSSSKQNGITERSILQLYLPSFNIGIQLLQTINP